MNVSVKDLGQVDSLSESQLSAMSADDLARMRRMMLSSLKRSLGRVVADNASASHLGNIQTPKPSVVLKTLDGYNGS
jgi:hypothetical protein